MIIEIICAMFLLIGAVFIFSASFGLYRLPDAYCRMHATTKASTPGVNQHVNCFDYLFQLLTRYSTAADRHSGSIDHLFHIFKCTCWGSHAGSVGLHDSNQNVRKTTCR